MARPRHTKGAQVTLFPFLSILSCVIGVLTLLIAGLSMGAMAAADMSGIEYTELQREIIAIRQVHDDLESRTTQLRETKQALNDAKVKAYELDRETRRLEGSQSELDAIEEEIARLRERALASERALKTARKEVARLEKRLAGLADARAESVAVLGPRDQGSSRKFKPRFVECRQGFVVLDIDRGVLSRKHVRIQNIENHPDYRKLLQQVHHAGTRGILIFLIRPDGIETFRTARSVALDKGRVACGYLPVPGDRKLDLRAFKK